MNKKTVNSVLSCALSAAMIATAVPMDLQAAGTNLALNKTATASEYEVEKTSPAKAVDGDLSTRWGTSQNKAVGEYLEVDLGEAKTIKQIVIHFERSSADQNILGYHVDLDGTTVYTKTEKAAQVETIVLEQEKTAQKVKITIDAADGGTMNWVNVGICEVQVYGEETEMEINNLNDLVAYLETLEGTTVEESVTEFTLPEVPEGFKIELNGADYEQIIGDDLKVVHPLTDKEVQVSYVVTNTATKESKKTGDIAYLVKGTYTQEENKNEKPVIIPEIQEWYSESAEKLAVSDLNKVTYEDADLEEIVDEFIADYEDFTGVTLKKVKGAASAEAFNFTKKAPDALLGEEGYTLEIKEDRINVQSESVTGNMYGMQTILQMYQQDAEGFVIGSMRDYPRFETRGLLLDIARKPVAMNMVRDIARTMRYYKMNDFQIHLSDNYIFLEDYGKYENEEKAFLAYDAFRLESGLTNEAGESPTAKDYSISKQEMQEFIQDQRSLGMKIVPEIDVPAHASSFTRIWPELMVKNKVSATSSNRPLIDHFDLTNDAAVEKIKEIFDDYTQGEDATFDSETTIHIGADEFMASATAYREFINEIVPYVKETNTVRMWGGLTWIDDHKTEIISEAIENVEINLWSRDWADGVQMYNMGYKLINTIDDYGYMVPDGSMDRANAYGDLLNITRIFNSFSPNVVRSSSYVELPSGDKQVLGAAYAIWSDNIDKRASGLTESDLYYRFFDALPFYAEKTWATTGKEKGTAAALSALAQEQGTGPRTNPYYQEEKIGDTYESYDFENGLEDGSENDRDLTAGTANVEDGALTLSGNNSYVTSPINKIGNGNELSFDITLTEIPEPGDIIFETTPEYGTHDIRIMEDGKLGFTRELYNYYFDYELPVGKTVNIKIVAEQQDTMLYVNGELIGEATGKFIHNDMVKKSGITHSTFAIPVERIGSETNAVEAVIDNVVVKESTEAVDLYNKSAWTGTTNSETVYSETEGLLEYAFDGKTSTIWHSNWQGASDKLTGSNSFYAEIDFGQAYTINQFSFTPRTPQASGRVTKADLYVKENAEDEWTLIEENAVFANDDSKKTFYFEEQEVRYAKFVAKESNDGWVAVSEFDIANKEAQLCTVYAKAEKGGTVSGAADVMSGTEITLKAAANKGYVFEGWYNNLGEKVSENAEFTFVVEKNAAYIARFKADETAESPVEEKVVRLSGTDRYQTGIAVAEELKAVLGVEKFETAIIATGSNFADALSGSYLAAVKDAPILLTNGKAANVAALHEYIKANVTAGGTIYVLGGEGAVSNAAADIDGYNVERLSGVDRYETNLAILAEAGLEGDDLIVATGKTFADSLSASAAGKPILLAKKNAALNDAQKAVAANFKNIYVVGGAGAVAESTAKELEEYGTVKRLSGAGRYETSVAVAKEFFADPDTVVLAYGKNFPDGLCGGVLAAALNAPLVLTRDGSEAIAADYVAANEVKSGYILGGTGVLKDETVKTIFALKSVDEIQ